MYRKNTAGQNLGFAMVSTAGAAGTGLTVAVSRVIDGGSQATATGIVTEKGGGQYNFAPSQADTNGNQISFLFTASGAVPTEKTIVTTAADPTSATNFGLTNLDATVSSRSTYAGADTAGTTTLLARLTNTRAGNLDNIATAAPTAVAIRQEIDSNSTRLAALAAGVIVSDKTGFKLAADGLDPIPIETGINARQALSPILAACAGTVSGAGTGSITIKGGNVNTTRIVATTDNSGNRTAVGLTLPA